MSSGITYPMKGWEPTLFKSQARTSMRKRLLSSLPDSLCPMKSSLKWFPRNFRSDLEVSYWGRAGLCAGGREARDAPVAISKPGLWGWAPIGQIGWQAGAGPLFGSASWQTLIGWLFALLCKSEMQVSAVDSSHNTVQSQSFPSSNSRNNTGRR